MPSILLIDDDTQLGPPLAQYFQRFDLALSHALKPSDGLALLRQRSFDAAILDVMLPEMDGFELCRTIRQTSDIPIVMVTALNELGDVERAVECGADDFLTKPVNKLELVTRVRSLLRVRRLKKELDRTLEELRRSSSSDGRG